MRIKKLTYFDFKKIKRMVSYLDVADESKIVRSVMDEPVGILNGILPLKYKFQSESYILLDGDEVLGIITVDFTHGNPYKINITRLIFKQDFYDVGHQLVDYVVSNYGAKGANTFSVYVDESHDELCSLFVKSCGFRQCSYENLWKLENFRCENKNAMYFRAYNTDDAKEVAELYNSELKTIYKSALEKISSEYNEKFFAGFNSYYKNRYVAEVNKRIVVSLSITTFDNLNFIVDFTVNKGYDVDYDTIINFVLKEISRRKSKFTIFIKHRQYMQNADSFEQYLHSRNLNCIQTQCVLIKNFYTPIKQTDSIIKVFSFGDKTIMTD